MIKQIDKLFLVFVLFIVCAASLGLASWKWHRSIPKPSVHPCCFCKCGVEDQHKKCFVVCAQAMDGGYDWPSTEEERVSCVRLCAAHKK